jgi:hypothetical protein
MVDLNYPGDGLIAYAGVIIVGGGHARVFGVGVRDNLGDFAAGYGGIAVHIQNRKKNLVDFPLAHGPFGNYGHFSFDPRVDNEILTGDVCNALNDSVDVGAFEIQGGAGGKTLHGKQQP